LTAAIVAASEVQPDVILLDEPSEGLAPKIVADMAAVMSNLSAPLDRSVPIDGGQRTTEQIVLLTEQVFQLRLDGHTQQEIGDQLGISQVYVCKLLKERLNRPTEAVEEVRRIELERLDKMHKRVAQFDAKLPPGSFSKDSIETQLKIAARRAALQGLDSAQKFEVTTKVAPDALTGLTDEELLLIRQIITKVRGVMGAPPVIVEATPQLLLPLSSDDDGDA
jgi:predicted transcriptional regulator